MFYNYFMPTTPLTSPQNAHIQLVRALLNQSKNRKEHKAFVAEGVRLVEEGVHSAFPLRFILYSDTLSQRGMDLLDSFSRNASLIKVEPNLFQSLSDTETSQGILAVFDLVQLSLPPQPDFLLILDNLRDPGNLGTILRTAEAAGVQAVLLSPGTADAFAPKVVRAGMGAHFRLPIHTLSWQEIVERVGSLPIYRTEMLASQTLYQADLCQPLALMISSEADGTSPEGKALTSRSLSIPMSGSMESLNAAVASAVLLFEVRRQRSQRK